MLYIIKYQFKYGEKCIYNSYCRQRLTSLKYKKIPTFQRKISKKYQQFTHTHTHTHTEEIQVACKYMKRHSKEMKNKNTLRCHFSSTRLAKIKALDDCGFGELASHLPFFLSNPLPALFRLLGFTMHPITKTHLAESPAGSSPMLQMGDHPVCCRDAV